MGSRGRGGGRGRGQVGWVGGGGEQRQGYGVGGKKQGAEVGARQGGSYRGQRAETGGESKDRCLDRGRRRRKEASRGHRAWRGGKGIPGQRLGDGLEMA